MVHGEAVDVTYTSTPEIRVRSEQLRQSLGLGVEKANWTPVRVQSARYVPESIPGRVALGFEDEVGGG